MIDTKELREKITIKGLDVVADTDILVVLDRLEAAEKERDKLKELNSALCRNSNSQVIHNARLAAENYDLRAKIEAMERMEKQEPSREWWDSLIADISAIDCVYRGDPSYAHDAYWLRERVMQMFEQRRDALPEGWKPIPEKHPTFDLVDLRLADGSVLCGCVPQSDGDYWWDGPSGEVFIDPRYAPVTHWRLAAAPEAKP